MIIWDLQKSSRSPIAQHTPENNVTGLFFSVPQIPPAQSDSEPWFTAQHCVRQEYRRRHFRFSFDDDDKLAENYLFPPLTARRASLQVPSLDPLFFNPNNSVTTGSRRTCRTRQPHR